MTRRLRVSHVLVQPVLVWDDGDNLAPGPDTAAVAVPLAELADYPAKLRDELARMTPPTDNPIMPVVG